MIIFDRVSKKFDDKPVIQNLSLQVEEGDRIAIIGSSGCGKSTLLKLIMGFQKPDSGSIIINGKNIARLSDQELKYLRFQFGMLFQSAALFDSMTVAENVGFSLVENLRLPRQKVRAIVAKTLETVGMSGYENHMPANLSGGQKKRIGLARAIASRPKILLYDEPTTGLDPVWSTYIEDLIQKLNTQFSATSIVVSHQQSTILRTAQHIYMMHEGFLLPPETPATIRQSKNPLIREFISGGLPHTS